MRSADKFFCEWLRLSLYWGTIAFSIAFGVIIAAKLYVETFVLIKFLLGHNL